MVRIGPSDSGARWKSLNTPKADSTGFGAQLRAGLELAAAPVGSGIPFGARPMCGGAIVRSALSGAGGSPVLNDAIKENVLVQLDNLRTHPMVAAALATGRVKLHGWVYQMETGM